MLKRLINRMSTGLLLIISCTQCRLNNQFSWELISHIYDSENWYGQEFVFKRIYASQEAEPGEFLR
jgi:hypothetical protein